MLAIGNKKYRNLQEQVGWNTEQIEKIFEFLDGINVSDNVVVVGDISTPLTTEQLEIVNREVAFIVYNGELYFKRNQDSFYIYFDIIFQVTSGTIITLTSSEIAVTKSNGALGITNSTDYVYSKTQVDSLLSAKADLTYLSAQLALKADLTGANFTGAITSPSIIEDMGPQYYISTTGKNAAIDLVYCGVCKNGNKITFVVAGTITPSANITSPTSMYGIYFYMPASVGSKLFPMLSSQVLDYKDMELFVNDYSNIQCKSVVYKRSDQHIQTLYTVDGLTGGVSYAFRQEVTFLLSDNLAS